MEYQNYEEGEIVDQPQKKLGKQANTLPFHGNESTMNLNPLILTNIQSSSYFKVNLFKLKTYHEVVDEIYYQVKHLEPWERGSRKNPGVGMCGSVRGVGAGGIVSSAYCLLYKLYTLKLTRKQVNGLMNHTDSPYIRGLGFMYIRYTQPPADLFDWYEDYFQDDEEIDVKAGGGYTITIGTMARLFMTKLDWFSTLFPRIPVPIQKQIEKRLNEYIQENGITFDDRPKAEEEPVPEPSPQSSRKDPDRRFGEPYKRSRSPPRFKSRDRDRERVERRPKERSFEPRRSPEREKYKERSYETRKSPAREKYREDRKRSHEKEHHHHRKHKKSKHKHKSHERSRDRSPHQSRDRSRERSHDRRHR